MTKQKQNELSFREKITKAIKIHNGFIAGKSDKDKEMHNMITVDCLEALYKQEIASKIEEIEKLKTKHLDKSDRSKWGEDYTTDEGLRVDVHNRAIDNVIKILKQNK